MLVTLVDFETRSFCNLLTKGAYTYARDPTTDIICCSYTFIDTENPSQELIVTWTPEDGPLTDDSLLVEMVEASDVVAAFNAEFDALIWRYVGKRYGFPAIVRWYCVSAQARVNGLPSSLDNAGRALGLLQQKDHKGKALIRYLSIPNPETKTFNEDPKKRQAMIDYCEQDVAVMREIMMATRLLTSLEQDDYLRNKAVNERGVMVDVELAHAAQYYAVLEAQELSAELEKLTDGAITKTTQTVRAARFLADQFQHLQGDGLNALALMTKHKDGVAKPSLDKEIRTDLLHAADEGLITLTDTQYDLISVFQEGSLSSVTKYKKMADAANAEDHRVRGVFRWYGAQQTGRYSSQTLQVHNFPSRDNFKTIDEAWDVYDRMMNHRTLPRATPVMVTLKRMLRHAITPPAGSLYVIGDYKGIEARVLPWLADTPESLALLARIVDGADTYVEAANEIGTSNRQVGKVAVLSGGYGGGVGAFGAFAKSFGLTMTEVEMSHAVHRWRAANPWAVNFWYELENAAKQAVRYPGEVFPAGRCTFYFYRGLMGGSLIAILPDDSLLTYPKATLKKVDGRYELSALKASVNMAADAKDWPRETLYGGKLAGHVTQATAGRLLQALLRDAWVSRYVVLHVHDEVVLEVPEDEAEHACGQLTMRMNCVPKWAAGLTVEAQPVIKERYGKF